MSQTTWTAPQMGSEPVGTDLGGRFSRLLSWSARQAAAAAAVARLLLLSALVGSLLLCWVLRVACRGVPLLSADDCCSWWGCGLPAYLPLAQQR
jgi:hypothetical protein